MKLAGEILILVLMLLSNGRVLTIRKPHLDPLVMLAPLSFLLSSLMIFAHSDDVFTLMIFFISILVLLSNFHALIRYGSRLVIDRYSPLMKTWAWFTTILSAGTLITLLVFAPVNVSAKELGVTDTQQTYSGSFTKGFEPSEKFERATGFVHEYSTNPNLSMRSNVILFMPDKRGDLEHYYPFLISLSKAGYTIISGDFYSRDCRWVHTIEDSRMLRRLGLVIRSANNTSRFLSQREFYTYNFSLEYETMLSIASEKYGPDCKFFLVTDNLAVTAAEDMKRKYPDLITGIYDISSSPEYKTPGYGFIRQTDPLFAKYLGFSKEKSLESIKACVAATSEAVNAVWLKK